MPCAANKALCDLLSLEELSIATRKKPRELMKNIRHVRSSLMRTVTPQETLGLADTVFQTDNIVVSSCRRKLQKNERRRWRWGKGRRKFCVLLRQWEEPVIKVIQLSKEWREFSSLKLWQMFSSLLLGGILAFLLSSGHSKDPSETFSSCCCLWCYQRTWVCLLKSLGKLLWSLISIGLTPGNGFPK